jgi:tartrate dehydratase beta subunit/fumarate hydratase class I family protein
MEVDIEEAVVVVAAAAADMEEVETGSTTPTTIARSAKGIRTDWGKI